MTFDEYIKNPMGKQNAVFSQRQMYMDIYSRKFDAILAREAGKINYRMYKDNDARYLLHIKIPSEVVEKFYYDVVIEFYTNDKTNIASNTLKNYNVRFFSNDPYFCFTYAYSFNKNNMFIEDLKPKMLRKALEERAVERNPKNLVGYVKSIFFAYLYWKLRGLDKKLNWQVGSVKYSKTDIMRDIMGASTKIRLRQERGKVVERKKATKKHSDSLRPKSVNRAAEISHDVEKARKTRSVSKTKVVNSSHYIKHSNKIKKMR